MRRNLVLLIAGLLIASGGTLLACSSGDPVPDEMPQEAPEYQSTAEDSPDQEAGLASDEGTPSAGLQAVGPVATVNGTEIPADAFNEQAQQLQAAGGDLPPELMAHLQEQIIEELVNRQLLQDAIDEADIEVTDEQIAERLEEFRQEFAETSREQYGEEMDFDEFVAEMGMSPEEVEEVVAETVAIESLLEQQGMAYPTSEEVRAFYDENPEYFTQPESIEARHILIRVNGEDEQEWEAAQEEIEALHRQVTEEDADFAEVAREHSDDGSAEQGGDLGRFARGQMVPEFEEAAFALEPSQISEPVRTAYGWHVIQVTDRHDEETMEFSEVEADLERELRNQAMQEALEDFIVELRQSADIQIHAENIQ